METQHAIYCTREEWIGVMMAVSQGMIAMTKDMQDGDKLPPHVGAAQAGSVPFMARVMKELELNEAYGAYAAGYHAKAEELVRAAEGK